MLWLVVIFPFQKAKLILRQIIDACFLVFGGWVLMRCEQLRCGYKLHEQTLYSDVLAMTMMRKHVLIMPVFLEHITKVEYLQIYMGLVDCCEACAPAF